MLSQSEETVVAAVTALITRYVSSYVNSDAEAFRNCFHAEMSLAVGARFVPSSELRRDSGEQPHYFVRRKGHWKPPVRTQISVRPINQVAALARVRWVFPETPTGIQYLSVSMYLCVNTAAGWKIHLVSLPTDSGEQLVTENSTYHEWDVERWPIYKDE